MGAKKIFVGNYKGGVGKTTSIYQIALHMSELEKKVLLIDLDPQCSLSEICLAKINKSLDTLKAEECLNYVYDLWNQMKRYPHIHYSLTKKHLIKQLDPNIDFIPSNIFYENGGLDDVGLRLNEEFEDLLVLQQFFQRSDLDNNYDYILFDCPPSNNIITQGAFLLSDYYMIPTIAQTMSVRGIIHYINTVEKIYTKYCVEHEKKLVGQLLFGSKPQYVGIFEKLKKNTVKNTAVLDELKADLREVNIKSLLSKFESEKYMFNTVIKNYEDIARATAKGVKSPDYADLTDEILDCLEYSDFTIKTNQSTLF